MTTQIVSQTTPLVQTFQGEINGETQTLVNARELHAFLESKQEFANWITKRIEKYGFAIGQDFLTILSKTPNGGRPTNDYHITLDMAKELSMVERNEKGKQARQYFIACEKALHQITTIGGNDPLHQINTNIQKMADSMAVLASGMQVLAQASHTQMRTLDRTEAYIGLLEMNQKGTVKVTPELADEVKRLKALGYSQADIARHLRLGKATVSLIVNDKYQFAQLFTNEPTADRQLATAQVLQELLPNFAQGDN